MFYIIGALMLLALTFAAHRAQDMAKKAALTSTASQEQKDSYDYRNAPSTFARRAPTVFGLIRNVLIALFVLLTVFKTFHQVEYGNAGLVRQFGAIVGQTGDGLVVTWPWQDVERATVRVQGHKFEKLDSFSVETQDVFVAATLNIRVSPEHIQRLYRSVGRDYFNILVAPRVRQAFKDETVKYKSVDIAPAREAIRRAVRDRLARELRSNSIIVEDLLIDDITFSPRFQAAIEAKQAETQLALQAAEGVKKARNMALQAIERERGVGEAALARATKEAEANRVVSASLTQELIQYRLTEKLAGNIQVMVVPSGTSVMMPMPTKR